MKKLPASIIALFLLVLLAGMVPASALTPTPKAKSSPTPAAKKLSAPAPAGPINLTMSPTFVNLVTDPGKKVSSQFTLTNNNIFAEYFKLTLVRYEVTDAGRGLTIVDLSKNDDFASWISFPETEFKVDPNQVKTVKFSITPAKDATLGYYYGILISRINENLPSDQAAVSASPVFSVIMEINTPNAKRELQFVEFTTDSFFYEYLPTTFNINVKNTGTIHIVPTGNVFIDSGSTKDIAILSANPGRGNVLPKSYRTFNTEWTDGMVTRVAKIENGKPVLDKNGKQVIETKFDFDKPLSTFRIGKYTAHLLMVYDNGQRDIPLEARLTFWVLPWRLMLGALGLVLLPFVLFRLISALRKKRRK
jgi:hypothetical protein